MIIEIKHRSSEFDSYRANRVKSLFNAESGSKWCHTAEIPIEDMEWQIGLIVGSSGSGKSSIGRQFFGLDKIINLYDGWDHNKPIIDCIDPLGSFDSVTGALANVGLGDVPAWLRPFSALSNGQQFRAGLARLIMDAPDQVVVDEFTSVVDRQIAKIGAMAFAKGWRRTTGKKVVLLSPHYDIIEWLQPDWVYNTDSGIVKKKAILESGQQSNLTFSRSKELTGDFLKSITI